VCPEGTNSTANDARLKRALHLTIGAVRVRGPGAHARISPEHVCLRAPLGTADGRFRHIGGGRLGGVHRNRPESRSPVTTKDERTSVRTFSAVFAVFRYMQPAGLRSVQGCRPPPLEEYAPRGLPARGLGAGGTGDAATYPEQRGTPSSPRCPVLPHPDRGSRRGVLARTERL
jgi:hypothetical protein